MSTQLRPRLGLETLDRRDLPSITLVGGNVLILGNGFNNAVTVTQAGGTLFVSQKSTSPTSSFEHFESNSFALSAVEQVVFFGRAGNDKFTNSTGVVAVAAGEDGNDTLRGGTGNDSLYGGNGTDFLYGGSGGDYLYGDAGTDFLYGEGGADRLYGGTESDYQNGGTGADWLSGEAGNDILDGGGADWAVDLLVGGPGADTFCPFTHPDFDDDGIEESVVDVVWGFYPNEGDRYCGDDDELPPPQ